MKIVYTPGIFDLFHIGHLRILKKARKLGDKLIIGLVSDSGATRFKRKPFIPYKQRKEIVSEFCDKVVLLKTDDSTDVIKRIKPDIAVHGNDYMPRGFKYAKKVVLLSYTNEQSSSKIIKKINESAGKIHIFKTS